jgi:hypothetical protein
MNVEKEMLEQRKIVKLFQKILRNKSDSGAFLLCSGTAAGW